MHINSPAGYVALPASRARRPGCAGNLDGEARSRDGSRLVFSSYRPIPRTTPGHSDGTANGGPTKPNAHLWYADRKGDGWGAPVFMAKASTFGHYHSWVQFGDDGHLYFRHTTPDWLRTQTMASEWNGREYDTPRPYDAAERWKGWRADINVVGGAPGPGGNTVFLDVATRNPTTGRGASDIWVSIRRGDAWTEPQSHPAARRAALRGAVGQ